MISAALPITHVHLDDQGRAWIDGTTMKVVELIAGVVANGWNAEELGRQYPHLRPAQIHGALAYYYDHQAALDAEIQRTSRAAAEERAASLNSPARQRLRAMGKLD